MGITYQDWEKSKEALWEEYKIARAEYLRKAREVDIKYAKANARFQIGDIISNGHTIIKITKCSVEDNEWNFIEPFLDYHGEVLSEKLLKPTGKETKFSGRNQNQYVLISNQAE